MYILYTIFPNIILAVFVICYPGRLKINICILFIVLYYLPILPTI